MIRFVELLHESSIASSSKSFVSLGEIWINEKYVVCIKEAAEYKRMLLEGILPSELNISHHFTNIITNNGGVSESHIVVGSPEIVAAKLSKSKNQLLKG